VLIIGSIGARNFDGRTHEQSTGYHSAEDTFDYALLLRSILPWISLFLDYYDPDLIRQNFGHLDDISHFAGGRIDDRIYPLSGILLRKG
jgi:hypothetical protein